MVSVIVFVTILSLTSFTFANPAFDSTEIEFRKFIHTYNRHYGSAEEYNKRFEIFKTNLNKIERLQLAKQGTARFGITKFADKTTEEIFPKVYSPEELNNLRLKTAPDSVIQTVPTDFDWRDHGAVTNVKNEGNCESSWIFSAIGNIEGQYAIKYNQTYSFSAQEVVDCRNEIRGCNIGGVPTDAYSEIMTLGGLELDSNYPYIAAVRKCKLDYSKIVVQVNDSLQLTKNEVKLASWLYENGPISAIMNGDGLPFYMDGIYEPDDCDAINLNHPVLIVGYGVQYGDPFWTIKNCWGRDWGEQGYLRLYRNIGLCGINSAATTSVIV